MVALIAMMALMAGVFIGMALGAFAAGGRREELERMLAEASARAEALELDLQHAQAFREDERLRFQVDLRRLSGNSETLFAQLRDANAALPRKVSR